MNNRSLPYCMIAFNSLKEFGKYWHIPEWKRPLSKIVYDNVFHSTNLHTGFITRGSLNKRIEYEKNPKFDKKTGKKKPFQPCFDHYLSPQFVGRMIMDNPSAYLEDFDVFKNIFTLMTSVVETTNPENTKLRQLTSNKGGNYKVFASTDTKYEVAEIELLKRPKGETSWIKATITDDKLYFPKDLIEYEKRFLV